jgi:hypothetical protein
VDRDELEELHYITHVANVPSIAARGILSHHRAARLQHQDVSLADVQDRRKGVRIPNGLLLHDYANLYITARNPMLYRRLCDGICDALCVISVSPNVLDLPNVVVTDRNAATNYCRFRPAAEGLAEVDGERVACTHWPHADPLEAERRWNAKFTEVLVPHVVEPDYLQEIYVGSRVAKATLIENGLGLDVTTDRHLFFGFS